jgi:hypothetical protein
VSDDLIHLRSTNMLSLRTICRKFRVHEVSTVHSVFPQVTIKNDKLKKLNMCPDCMACIKRQHIVNTLEKEV